VSADIKFRDTHEWARLEDDGTVTVGISDHAQSSLGDLVYVELPAVDTMVSSGQESAVVESVKAASDIYSPLSGKVVAVNDALAETPELINDAPYGEGWLYRIAPDNPAELDNMLDEAAYTATLD